VAYQTEEQQVEQLKEWWKENGTPLMVGAVLGLSGFFGWKYWSEEQRAAQSAASDLYMTVSEEIGKPDTAKLIENANAVKSKYPDSSYAILSAFHLAKQAVDSDKIDDAIAELNWVINNHNGNELVAIAKIRLARIYVTQQKAEQALTLISFDSESGYAEIASLIKGDALIVLDRKTEALEAYKAANAAGKVTANHSTLKLMIDELTVSETIFSDSDSDSDEMADASMATNTDSQIGSGAETETATEKAIENHSETDAETKIETDQKSEKDTNIEASK